MLQYDTYFGQIESSSLKVQQDAIFKIVSATQVLTSVNRYM